MVLIVFIANVFVVASLEPSEHVIINFYTVVDFIATLGVVVVFLLINKLVKKIKISKKIKIIVFITILILYFLAQIGWIYVRHAVPNADQSSVTKTAVALADGHLESISGLRGYLEKYPQQLTLAYVYSLVLKIFNTRKPMVLQFLNAFSNCLTIIALLLITKQLSKKYEVNKTKTLIISLMFITLPMLATFVYGDFPSLPFCLFAIYFIMKYSENKKIRYSLLSAVCIAYACILRMNNLIFVIALVTYNFLEILHLEEKTARKILREVILLIIFIVIVFVPPSILKRNLQNKLDLDKNKTFPTIAYLYMGMCNEGPMSYGWYDPYIANIGFGEKENSIKECKNGIEDRVEYFMENLKNPIFFYSVKIASMWAENTYGSTWYNQSFNFENNDWRKIESEKVAGMQEKLDSIVNKSNNYLAIYQKAIILIIFGTTLCVLLKYRKNISNDVILLILCFMGGFMFHILWEGKSRYIIPYIIVLIPLVSINVEDFNFKKKLLKEK